MIDSLPILPFVANWSAPVKVTWAFITGDREALSGAVGRDNARLFARRTIEATGLAFGAIYRQWLTARETQPAGLTVFAAPLWSDCCALTVAAAIADTVLNVSPHTNMDLRTELLIVACDAATGTLLIESGTITEMSADQITLDVGLTNAFPVGATVFPLVRGRVVTAPQATHIVPGLVALPLVVVEDLAALGDAAYTNAVATYTYRGVPIFPLTVAWHESPTATLDRGAKAVATGTNREAWAATRDYARLGGDFAVMTIHRNAITALVRFFLDRRGRWQRFWLAMPAQLTTLAANIGATDTTILLHADDFASYATLFNAGGSRYSTISISNGVNVWYRRVTSLNAGQNQIVIDAALGMRVAASCCSISPLKLVRFATDDLVLEYAAPRLATAKISFAEAEKEYAEVLATGGTFNGTIDEVDYIVRAA